MNLGTIFDLAHAVAPEVMELTGKEFDVSRIQFGTEPESADPMCYFKDRIGIHPAMFFASEPTIRVILAHELVHASDDQNYLFNALSRDIDREFPSMYADVSLDTYPHPMHVKNDWHDRLTTLVESHASLIEERYSFDKGIPFDEVNVDVNRVMPRDKISQGKLCHYVNGQALVALVYQKKRDIGTLFDQLPRREDFSNPRLYFSRVFDEII